jgi:hypothetical protein
MNEGAKPPEDAEPPEEKSLPVLAQPEAADEVGKALRDRVSASLDNTGKALAVIAGVGVFFYAAGYFVEWQRFKKGGLPSEQLLALLPRGQIAAAGVKELFISLIFGGALLALLGWGLVALTRVTKTKANDSQWAARLYSVLSRELLFPTAVVGFVTLLIVPFDMAGLIVAAILTALFFYMLRLVHAFLEEDGEDAKLPIWQLSLAVGLAAIVLTGARQWEFPEPRPEAEVLLEDEKVVTGTYVASDGDKVLIRRKGDPSRLIVLSSDEIDRVRLWQSSFNFPRDPSLLDRALHGVFGTDINLSCIPPECRWDEDTRFGPSSAF